MTDLAQITILVVLAVLAAVAFGPALAAQVRGYREARRRQSLRPPRFDPGRERRAERRARELLRSVVGSEEHAMYVELGFLRVLGRRPDGRPDGYGYLIYPHRPIISFDVESGEPLSEYCVEFPDRGEPENGSRLPDADDVLAKWMSLHGDERNLIEGANMHLVGRQVDPAQARRDLRRLREWEARRDPGSVAIRHPSPARPSGIGA